MTRLLLPLFAAFAATAAAAQTPPPPPPPAGAAHPADTDRDGAVTRAEALADADRRFAAMDADGDGKLSREERRAYRDAHRPARTAADHRDPAGRRDADRAREGGRGGEEMTQAQFRDRAAAMFDRTDTDRDGRIDSREREAARLLMRSRMIERRD